MVNDSWLEESVVDGSWLDNTAEDETVVEARAKNDELVEDDTIENAQPDDETEPEAILLDENGPEDEVTDKDVKATLLEVLVKPGMNDESDDDIAEMEEAADNAPLKHGVIEDGAVVASTLEIAEEVELAIVEETGDMIDAAEDESAGENPLFIWT